MIVLWVSFDGRLDGLDSALDSTWRVDGQLDRLKYVLEFVGAEGKTVLCGNLDEDVPKGERAGIVGVWFGCGKEEEGCGYGDPADC